MMRRSHLVLLAGLVGMVTAQGSGDGMLEAEDEVNGTTNGTTNGTLFYDLPEEPEPEPEDECWDLEAFHPSIRDPESTDWEHCSQKSPRTWREEDLDVVLKCDDDAATFSYDLSRMDSVNWMEGVQALVTVKDGILIKSTTPISNFSSKNEERLDDFCPGITYSVCLDFNPGGSESRSICKECSTTARTPTSNPTGLEVTGVRDLALEWDPLEPECANTQYDILINGVLEETVTDSQKWLRKEPGTYEVAIRARNEAGPSEAELVIVKHNVQELVPPKNVVVVYRMEGEVLVATITWEHSMTFYDNATDSTNKGYYMNLYNKADETSTMRPTEAHDRTLDIGETFFDVNFTDTMDWTIEYSMQTFYGDDGSEPTERAAVFSEQIELLPPSTCITQYNGENSTKLAKISLWHNMKYVFKGLEVVATIWTGNGTDLLTLELGENSTFEIPLEEDWGQNVQYSVRTVVGGSSSNESEKHQLLNNICFGYVNGWYILPYCVAAVLLLLLILLAIVYCICQGCCCRPLEQPKKDKSPKTKKGKETKLLIPDNTDNGYGGAESKVPLLPSQTPNAFKKGPQTPGTPGTPIPIARRFLFSKSRDSIINLSEPGWMWRKNIESDLF